MTEESKPSFEENWDWLRRKTVSNPTFLDFRPFQDSSERNNLDGCSIQKVSTDTKEKVKNLGSY